MKQLFVVIALLMIFASCGFAQEGDWSEPVNGIRARLSVYTPDELNPRCYRVLIEIQNVSPFAGQMKIRYSPERVTFQVADKTGKRFLERSNNPWSGQGGTGWEPTLLPNGGTIKFPIHLPGTGYRLTDTAILDMGAGQTWMIPQDGTTYFLSGRFQLERQNGDHPYNPYIDWSGTLLLPPVEIPIRE